MNDSHSNSKPFACKLVAFSLAAVLVITSVFAITSRADPNPYLPPTQGWTPGMTNDTHNITNIADWVKSDPGNATINKVSNITFNGMYRPLRIFFYDDYEEDSFGGSIREYLVSKGHTVDYTHDNVGDINVMTSYPDYDVIVAEHTCGGDTLTGLQQWFQAGKGYVALIGQAMYNNPPSDNYIMNLLGVNGNGNSGTGWDHSQFVWADAIHPIRTYPNSAWTITSLPNAQYNIMSISSAVTPS
jgi:hypothetical protein